MDANNEQAKNTTEKETAVVVTPEENTSVEINDGKNSSEVVPTNGVANKKNRAKSAARTTVKTGANETQKNAPIKKQAFMYLGPNVPGGILFTGSVYKEYPEHLKNVFERIPEIKELFIEIKNVPTFKNEMERQGSEAFRLRQNVERLINEGALKNVI